VQSNISKYHLEMESSVLILQDRDLSGTQTSREGPCPNILSRSNKPQVFTDLCGKKTWPSWCLLYFASPADSLGTILLFFSLRTLSNRKRQESVLESRLLLSLVRDPLSAKLW